MKKAAQKLGGSQAEDVSGRKLPLLNLPNVTVRQCFNQPFPCYLRAAFRMSLARAVQADGLASLRAK